MAARKDLALQDILTQSAPPTITRAPSAQANTALAVQRLEAPKPDAVSSFVDPERAVAAPAAPPPQALSANSARLFGAPPSLPSPAPGLAVRRTPLRVTERKNFALKSPLQNLPACCGASTRRRILPGNSRGLVQRSTDAGESWQIVPLSERISFRAVATAELDVWAGGSEGTLFHSSDGGSNWTETKVAGEDAKMSGDIVRINARTPSQVTIRPPQAKNGAARTAASIGSASKLLIHRSQAVPVSALPAQRERFRIVDVVFYRWSVRK